MEQRNLGRTPDVLMVGDVQPNLRTVEKKRAGRPRPYENGTVDNHSTARFFLLSIPSEACYTVDDGFRQAVQLLQTGKRRAFRMSAW